MFGVSFETPFFGNYSMFLAFVVAFLVWKLMFNDGINRPKVPSVTNMVEKSISKPTNNGERIKKLKSKKCGGKGGCCSKEVKLTNKMLKIYFATCSGQSEKYAEVMRTTVESNGFQCSVKSLETKFYIDEELPLQKDGATIFLVDCQDDGSPPECAQWFHESLYDSRFGKELLADFKFAVFCDDSICITAQDWDRCLWKLGGQRLKKLKPCATLNGSSDIGFDTWKDELMLVLNGQTKRNGCCGPKDKNKTDADGTGESSSCDSSSDAEDTTMTSVVDVEDLVLPLLKIKKQ